MLTTGCAGCCFLKQDDKGKGCGINQLCVTNDGKTFAPGYCRMCRSHKWAKKQNTTDLCELLGKIVRENALQFDLLVFFNESAHTINHLERTISSEWYQPKVAYNSAMKKPYVNKIIIVDTTGFGSHRQNLAMKYLKNRTEIVESLGVDKNSMIPIVVDSSVDQESIDQRESTIKRLSKQIKSPFFMAISAGQKLRNLDHLGVMIQNVPSRVIHWLFPYHVGSTMVIPNRLSSGLFITKPYKTIMTNPGTISFTQQLRKEEQETGMALSWFCDSHYASLTPLVIGDRKEK